MDRQAIRFENRSSTVFAKIHKSLLFYFKRLDLFNNCDILLLKMLVAQSFTVTKSII